MKASPEDTLKGCAGLFFGTIACVLVYSFWVTFL